MKKLVYDIINRLDIPEIDFADVRYTNTDIESIFFEDGSLKSTSGMKDSVALGIRVYINGCAGFAGISNLSKSSIDKAIKTAISNARHGSKFKAKKEVFPKIVPTVKSYIYDPKEDPFRMDMGEKIGYFGNIAKSLTGKDNIVYSDVSTQFYRQYKIYANTEGTFVDSLVYDVMPEMQVIAAKGDEVQTRTFPGHMTARRGGFEAIREMEFEKNAEVIIREANQLLDAPRIEEEKADIIIGGSQLALQLHESIGHATEADRILGMEISYAGKTFIKPHMFGNFKYGSDILTVYSDSSDTRGIGYHPVDDEGVPGKRVDIIKDGILMSQQTSRFIGQELGLEATSNMKASFANNYPLVRMTNLCIEPVKGSLEELIKDTENGYYIDFTKCWSIDDNRNNFQFTTEIGWKIKDGEIKHVVKEPTYYGITKDFWNACDRICGPEEWKYHGTFHCGKGEPGQAMHLSHGVAPARFKDIVVNVKA